MSSETYGYSKPLMESIQARAENTLASIDDESRQQSVDARAVLLDWLTDVYQNKMSHPSSLVTDDMVEAVTSALTFQAQQGDECAAQLDALVKELPQDKIQNTIRFALGAFLGACGPKVVATYSNAPPGPGNIMDVDHGDPMIRHIAFVTDTKSSTLMIKNGDDKVQPYGALNDELFVPAEEFRLLMTRSMYVAVGIPIAPPFKVTLKEAEQVIQDAQGLPQDLECPLFESEFILLLQGLRDLDEEIRTYNDVLVDSEKTEAEVDTQFNRLVDTIKLIIIQLPRVNEMLRRRVNGDDSRLPLDIDSMDRDQVKSLAYGLSEWISKKLDEYRTKNVLDTTDMSFAKDEVSPAESLVRMLDAVQGMLDRDHVLLEDVENQVMSALVVVPSMRTLFDSEWSKMLQESDETSWRMVLLGVRDQLQRKLGTKKKGKK